MIKPANKTLIGGFVVTAVILLMTSIVLFGSGKFFKKSVDFIMFFTDSVMGLDEGAPVLFKGVQVGRVKEITLMADYEKGATMIPVTIEVFPEKFGLASQPEKLHSRIETMVRQGLKGQLVSKSLVTGQMVIELEIHPEKPALRHNISGVFDEFLEVPTIASTAERFARALEQVDLEKLQHNIESILTGIDKLVNSPEIAGTLTQLLALLTETRDFLVRIDQGLDPLADDLGSTIASYRQLARDLDHQIEPLADSFRQTIMTYNGIGQDFAQQLSLLSANLDLTLNKSRKMIDSIGASLGEEAPLMVGIEESFAQFNATARSLRDLTDYLRQHPESLLRGRGRSAQEE